MSKTMTAEYGKRPNPIWPTTLVMPENPEIYVSALRNWGYRIGLAARDALKSFPEIEQGVGDRRGRVKYVSDHFGLANAQHSLHVEPLGWLRLSETQAMKGLQHFLEVSDERVRLFLESLAPNLVWPRDLRDLRVQTEVRAVRGRIDLMICGYHEGTTWGAIVEAKFEHSLHGNPLSHYMREGTKLGMQFVASETAERTGALIVLGKVPCRKTRRKLLRNKMWRWVHWREVLRRFDSKLDEASPDTDFQRFRRTVWQRIGDQR